ncbi:MAG: hypothetical protein QXT33_06765 [Thermofilum sp.]
MAKGVFVRGVDERLYAEVKARAALLGITVSQAVNQALEMWLRAPPPLEQARGAREPLRSAASRLAAGRGKGYLVVANDGAVSFRCETLEEAVERLRGLYEAGLLKNSLIKPLEARRVEFVEVGGGGLEV